MNLSADYILLLLIFYEGFLFFGGGLPHLD